MASASSLLGLMNHLQTFESSVISVLMEAAMKLSALTDTSVFVMVETPEGRQFSGKRHLCDAYACGGLTPRGNDVEMEVDPSISALRPRFNPAELSRPKVRQNEFFSNGNGFHELSTSPGTSRKRSLEPSTSSSCPLKVSRQEHETTEIKTEVFIKNESIVDLTSGALDNQETANFNNVQRSSLQNQEMLNIPDDDEPEILEEIVKDASSDAGSAHFSIEQTTNASMSSNDPIPEDILPFPLPSTFTGKMQAIRSLSSPELFNKGSMEYRLLTSCIYQLGALLGKQAVNLTATQPGFSAEDFLCENVSRWMSHMPYLWSASSSGTRIDTGLCGMTVVGFVRHRARNAFRKSFKMPKNGLDHIA